MRYIFIFLSLVLFSHAEKISIKTLKSEKRFAYVIGNGDYDDSPIDHAVLNAQKMKAFLKEYDFEVIYKEDASKREIIKGLRDFNSNMKPSSVALFYFCGHMIQIKGKNYLIPVEASIESDYHVLYEAIDLDAILNKMEKSGSRLNIVMIDSSYKNPFGDRFRATKAGIASLKKRRNTHIILSAKPNKVLKPYPFTTKLLPILSLKGTSNKEGFAFFQKRYPQSYFRLSKNTFFFNTPNKLENKEEKLWLKTLGLGTVAAYTAYLKKHPNGKHTKQAKLDISTLNKKEEDRLKEQAKLEAQAKKDTQAQQELEKLKKEEEDKARIQAEEKARIQAEEKAIEAAAIAAVLAEEKRLAKEHARFVEPQMVLIKAGSFMMGSDLENSDETPAHQVVIENDFYMGKYEVTNVEYNEYLKATKQKRLVPPNWAQDMQPVIAVSWDDANAYAAWLSGLTGKKYRLPSEQEWEYAARAGTNTRYYWGDRDTSAQKDAWRVNYPNNAHDYAWIKTNSNNTTHNVGAKKPNPWGLYDMTGNVWEWCSSTYTPNYSLPAEEELLKVIRGGSWFSTVEEVTLSHRGSNVSDFTSYSTGFRLLREK